MGLCGFVGEVVDVLPILPLGHPLIVVPSAIAGTHAMWVANEEGTNFMLYTEVDHLACGLVSLITDTTFSASALLIFCELQVLPPSGVFLALALLFRDVSHLHGTPSFESTNTAPRYNHGLACISRYRRKVYLSQINGCMNGARNVLNLGYLHTDMQFKAIVPHKGH